MPGVGCHPWRVGFKGIPQDPSVQELPFVWLFSHKNEGLVGWSQGFHVDLGCLAGQLPTSHPLTRPSNDSRTPLNTLKEHPATSKPPAYLKHFAGIHLKTKTWRFCQALPSNSCRSLGCCAPAQLSGTLSPALPTFALIHGSSIVRGIPFQGAPVSVPHLPCREVSEERAMETDFFFKVPQRKGESQNPRPRTHAMAHWCAF